MPTTARRFLRREPFSPVYGGTLPHSNSTDSHREDNMINSKPKSHAHLTRFIEDVVWPHKSPLRSEGFAGELEDFTDALRIAEEIGFDLTQAHDPDEEERYRISVRQRLESKIADLETRMAEQAAKRQLREAARKLKAIREARRLGTTAPAPDALPTRA